MRFAGAVMFGCCRLGQRHTKRMMGIGVCLRPYWSGSPQKSPPTLCSVFSSLPGFILRQDEMHRRVISKHLRVAVLSAGLICMCNTIYLHFLSSHCSRSTNSSSATLRFSSTTDGRGVLDKHARILLFYLLHWFHRVHSSLLSIAPPGGWCPWNLCLIKHPDGRRHWSYGSGVGSSVDPSRAIPHQLSTVGGTTSCLIHLIKLRLPMLTV